MKLLLTSTGIENDVIAKALHALTGKAPGDVKIGFVPTAANAETGNKDWFLHMLMQLWRFGYSWIDIIDPTAADVDWQSRLESVDVIYLSGGNTFHLLNQMRQTGLDTWLAAHKDDKIIVGASAGSIVMTPTIAVAGVEPGDPNLPDLKDLAGLAWVSFEISPHVPSMVSYDVARSYAESATNPIYLLDDSSAVVVDGDIISVVSAGQWQYSTPKSK